MGQIGAAEVEAAWEGNDTLVGALVADPASAHILLGQSERLVHSGCLADKGSP